MGQMEQGRMSSRSLLTCHRELLVSRLRSVQCILDNLLASGFVCEEDVDIVLQTPTKPEQVRLRTETEGVCQTLTLTLSLLPL